MVIGGVIVICVVLFIVGFVVPRFSHGPQREAQHAFSAFGRGAGKAPGALGRWLRKPFQTSSKAAGKSAAAGRTARSKAPV
jgi:Family of unknown function (DUF6411)